MNILGKKAIQLYSKEKQWEVIKGSEMEIPNTWIPKSEAIVKLVKYKIKDANGNYTNEVEEKLKVMVIYHTKKNGDVGNWYEPDASIADGLREGDIIDTASILVVDYKHKTSGKIIQKRLRGEVIGNIHDEDNK